MPGSELLQTLATNQHEIQKSSEGAFPKLKRRLWRRTTHLRLLVVPVVVAVSTILIVVVFAVRIVATAVPVSYNHLTSPDTDVAAV